MEEFEIEKEEKRERWRCKKAGWKEERNEGESLLFGV